MSKLEKLKALAKAATPGPWVWIGVRATEDGLVYRWTIGDGKMQAISRIENTVSGRPLTEEDTANAKFIAEFNPHLVLGLLALVEESKSLLETKIADRLVYENPEESSVGVRACCGAASHLPHSPKCEVQSVLDRIRKFDEGD